MGKTKVTSPASTAITVEEHVDRGLAYHEAAR